MFLPSHSALMGHPLPNPPHEREGAVPRRRHDGATGAEGHLPLRGGGWEGDGRALRALLIALLLLLAAIVPVHAQSENIATLVDALATGSFKDREEAIQALAGTRDERVPAILSALAEGDLYVVEATGKVVMATKAGAGFA